MGHLKRYFSDNPIFLDPKTPSKTGGYPSPIPMQTAEKPWNLCILTKKSLHFPFSCAKVWSVVQDKSFMSASPLFGFAEAIRAPRGLPQQNQTKGRHS